jgi:hypothetical protein
MNKRPFFTFLIFVVISTTAWLFVKLSEEYTTQVQFGLMITNEPADKWLASPEQVAKLAMTTNGFHTLRYKMLREQKRVVNLPLSEVPYRLESGRTYSFSSLYVTERVAEMLDINASDLVMNDDKIYFELDPLKSKVVPVKLLSDIRPQRQYGIYGSPTLEPSSVTIYGPQEIIDTLKSVSTMMLSRVNVSASFSETVPLNLFEGKVHSEVSSVTATVQIEKFTEADVEVPVSQPKNQKVRFFPETVKVRCLVAIKDYSNLKPDAFRVEVNGQKIKDLQPLLDVNLTVWPKSVQILNVTPEKVEYLIVQ